MTISLFGFATDAADGASRQDAGTGTPTWYVVEITPPVSMAAGQLVVIDVVHRDNTVTDITMSETGGQTWTSEVIDVGGATTSRRFWCRFNGTWDATPSVALDNLSGAGYIVGMAVFSPTVVGSTWVEDVTYLDNSITVSAGTLTFPGFSTINANAVAVVSISTADDNNNTLNGGSSWSEAFVGHDNPAGTGLSLSLLYQVKDSPGALGSFVLTENAGGANDNGRYMRQSWYEVPPEGGVVPSMGRCMYILP